MAGSLSKGLQSTFQPRHTQGGEGVLRLLECRRKNNEGNSFFRDGGYWFTTLFSLRGRAFPLMPLFWYIAYSSAIIATVLYAISDPENNVYLSQMSEVQGTIGALLGLLLAFRYQQGYDRWMEGRMTWSTVGNLCAKLARYSQVYVEDKPKAQKLVAYASIFPRLLKLHLHESTELQVYGEISLADAQDLASSGHMPLCMLGKMSVLVEEMEVSGTLKFFILEEFIKALNQTVGKSNTISSAPSPFAYVAHLRSIMIGFLLLFPFIFAPTMRWYCLIVCAFSGFAFLGVETVTLEIESPFGVDYNDLPLNSYNTEIHEDICTVAPDLAPTFNKDKVVSINIENRKDDGTKGAKFGHLPFRHHSIPKSGMRSGNDGDKDVTDRTGKSVTGADSAYTAFTEFKKPDEGKEEEAPNDVRVAIDELDVNGGGSNSERTSPAAAAPNTGAPI